MSFHPVFRIHEPFMIGRKRLLSVPNATVAAEFVAGTRAWDELPTLDFAEVR